MIDNELNTDQLYERLLKSILDHTEPRLLRLRTLAHYTTNEVLSKIVRGKEIWFSRADEMNDIHEVLAGKRLIYKFATDETHVGRSMWAIYLWNEEIHQLLTSVFYDRISEDLENTFISCWSAAEHTDNMLHDDLTMWRAYGDNGQGVAIVLDPSALYVGKGLLEIQALPVYYETEDEFRDRAEACFRDFALALLSLEFKPPITEYQKLTIVEAFAQICFFLAVSHKHPGFKDEKEWRFVWTKNRPTENALDHYLRSVPMGNKIVEKFCLPLEASQDYAYDFIDLQKALFRVIVGPSNISKSNANGIRRLLIENGFSDAEQIVEESSIPFRFQR